MASVADDNILVMNQGKHPLVSYNFMLRVEGLFDLPTKSVRSFSRELEYDMIQEGGLNDYVHMRRKPISKPFTVEFERYVGVDFFDPLPLGAELALPVLLMVSRYQNKFIPANRTYVFTGCTVMKKTYGELDGNRSELLVETTTMSFRELLVVDIPWVGDAPKLNAANNQNEAVSALGAMETLAKIKQKSQAAYDRIKNAAEDMSPIIEDIIKRIDAIDTAIDNAKKLTSNAQTALEEGERELTKAEIDAETKDGKFKEALATYGEKEKELKGIEKELNDAIKAYDRQNSAYQDAVDKYEAAKFKKEDKEQEIKNLQEINDELNDRLTKISGLAPIEGATGDDGGIQKWISAKEKELEAVNTANEKLESELNTAQEKADTAKSDLDSFEEDGANKLEGFEEARTERAIRLSEAENALSQAQEELSTQLALAAAAVAAATAENGETAEATATAESTDATATAGAEGTEPVAPEEPEEVVNARTALETAQKELDDLKASLATEEQTQATEEQEYKAELDGKEAALAAALAALTIAQDTHKKQYVSPDALQIDIIQGGNELKTCENEFAKGKEFIEVRKGELEEEKEKLEAAKEGLQEEKEKVDETKGELDTAISNLNSKASELGVAGAESSSDNQDTNTGGDDNSEGDGKEDEFDEKTLLANDNAKAQENIKSARNQYDEVVEKLKEPLNEAEDKSKEARNVLRDKKSVKQDLEMAHEKAKAVENAVIQAKPMSKSQKDLVKEMETNIPTQVAECGSQNDKVQAAEEISETQEPYPKVQKAAGYVQKTVANLGNIQGYYKNVVTDELMATAEA